MVLLNVDSLKDERSELAINNGFLQRIIKNETDIFVYL